MTRRLATAALAAAALFLTVFFVGVVRTDGACFVNYDYFRLRLAEGGNYPPLTAALVAAGLLLAVGAAAALPGKIRRVALPVALAAALGAGIWQVRRDLDLPGFFAKQSLPYSDFYERHYVAPTPARLLPPATPRNLVVVFIESMEDVLADLPEGAPLRQLARENLSFSGFHNGYGTTWTQGSLFGVMTGLPYHFFSHHGLSPKFGDLVSGFGRGLSSLGKILAAHGYRRIFVQGTHIGFSGTDSFLLAHGFPAADICGYDRIAREYPRFPEGSYWGYRDRDTFAVLKDKLAALPAGEPFLAVAFTIDTHMGTEDALHATLEETVGETARAAADFVAWVRRQPFGAATTVVMFGDHLNMKLRHPRPPADRTIFNVFVNPAATPPTTARRFSQIDMFPTLLESTGFRIDGGRLGMGTSLFNGRPTLLEELGPDTLADKLGQRNKLYDKLLE